MNKNERESQENILRISHIVSKAFSLGKEHNTDEAYETLHPYLERDEVAYEILKLLSSVTPVFNGKFFICSMRWWGSLCLKRLSSR